MTQLNGSARNGAAEPSRSGLLVAQQVLNDKLSNSGQVRQPPCNHFLHWPYWALFTVMPKIRRA